jgi:hypothetical protein
MTKPDNPEDKRDSDDDDDNRNKKNEQASASADVEASTQAVHDLRRKFKQLTRELLSQENAKSNLVKPLPQHQQQHGWDELCLGVWLQNADARRHQRSGYCAGLKIVKASNVGDIQSRHSIKNQGKNT